MGRPPLLQRRLGPRLIRNEAGCGCGIASGLDLAHVEGLLGECAQLTACMTCDWAAAARHRPRPNRHDTAEGLLIESRSEESPAVVQGKELAIVPHEADGRQIRRIDRSVRESFGDIRDALSSAELCRNALLREA